MASAPRAKVSGGASEASQPSPSRPVRRSAAADVPPIQMGGGWTGYRDFPAPQGGIGAPAGVFFRSGLRKGMYGGGQAGQGDQD